MKMFQRNLIQKFALYLEKKLGDIDKSLKLEEKLENHTLHCLGNHTVVNTNKLDRQ